MAKPATTTEPVGMQRPDLKRYLKLARDEPVKLAFGIGNDGKAVVLMDKYKEGASLERTLKQDAPDCRAYRHGTASIDPANTKTAQIKLNKAGGGYARKLVVAFKGTGVSKVRMQLENGTEFEVFEEPDETEGADDEGPAPLKATAAPVTTGSAPTAPAPASAPVTAPATAPASAPNAEALGRDLTALVKRMLAVLGRDPTQKAALAELATDAQASLKRGDLAQASAGIDILREAIGDAEAAAPPSPALPASNGRPPPPRGADPAREGEEILAAVTATVRKLLASLAGDRPAADHVKRAVASIQGKVRAGDHVGARAEAAHLGRLAAGALPPGGLSSGGIMGGAVPGDGQQFQKATATPHAHAQPHPHPHAGANDKARQVWLATRQAMLGEVDKLHKTFEAALQGHDGIAGLTKTVRTKIDAALGKLDDGLAHALHAINTAATPADRAKHVEHAHKLVGHYRTHVTSDPTVKMLDRNPFHPITIEQTVVSTLERLIKHIR